MPHAPACRHAPPPSPAPLPRRAARSFVSLLIYVPARALAAVLTAGVALITAFIKAPASVLSGAISLPARALAGLVQLAGTLLGLAVRVPGGGCAGAARCGRALPACLGAGCPRAARTAAAAASAHSGLPGADH